MKSRQGLYERGADLYAKVLRCYLDAPSTRPEISRKLGISLTAANYATLDLEGIGFVREVGRRGGSSHPTVYSASMERDLSKAGVSVIRQLATGFRDVVAALEQSPATRLELVEITGRCEDAVMVSVEALRRSGLAHICAWNKRESGHGNFIPVFALAVDASDERRPRKVTKAEACRKWRAKAAGWQAQVTILQALKPELFREAA